jgi:Organic solvent tolerance protein OstA
MNNKIKKLFATIIFSLLPFSVWSEIIETQISADTITVQPGGILYAEGNVIVRYGNNKIKARALKFNQKSNQIQFTELQDFYDGKAIKFFS